MNHITICTREMKHYFGKIISFEISDLEMAAQTGHCPSKNGQENLIRTDNSPSVLLSPIGQKAQEFWQEIPMERKISR